MSINPLFNGIPGVFRLFQMYELGWSAAMPFFRLNARLADGYAERRLDLPLPSADIWIQSASVGEAFLSREIVRMLSGTLSKTGRVAEKTRILLTANTRQGLDILQGERIIETRNRLSEGDAGVEVETAFFPFDRPSIMARAVRQVRPRLMVVLETELWPGLLVALKHAGIPLLLANGRISEKSLAGYRRVPGFWRRFRPDRVMAISLDDARRFRLLFGDDGVTRMQNIKFDRLALDGFPPDDADPLRSLFPDGRLIVFGSVRREEEADLLRILQRLRQRLPDHRLALFPRHIHRLEAWKALLNRANIPWRLRSEAGEAPVPPSHLLLWDRFGELTFAYALADAAFIGGSLAPLGGQNFLEPMIAGIVPVIGPHWKDFHWVGDEVFRSGLAEMGADWRAVADLLEKRTTTPLPRAEVRQKARSFIEARRGGTWQVREMIQRMAL